MSSDEKIEPRDESESTDEDLVAHRYVTEEPRKDGPELERKRKVSEEAGDPEGDEFGRRRK